jgi:hypothetical protein
MNAHTPADLLADAFTCSGSVRPDSAPWKAQAIANLESRLAVRWAADRAKERKPPQEIVLDYTGHETTRDERDRAVYDAIGRHALVADIQAAAKLPHAQVLDSIRRLVHGGYITRKRIGGNSIHAQAIGSPPEGLVDAPRTRASTAMEASAAARKIAKAQKAAEVEALRAEGLSLGQIIERMGLSRSYVCQLMRGFQ